MTFNEFLEEWRNESEFIKAKTSGSTGEPKEIHLSKKFVEESAKRTNAFFGIKAGDILHSCVAPDYIGGKMMAVRSEISGAILSWETPSNEPLKTCFLNTSLDLVAVVPSQVPFILSHLQSLPKIKNLLIGGSAIHPDLRVKIAESNLNAYESYGMTETASHIALRKVAKTEKPFLLLPEIKIALDNDNCLNIKFKDGTEIKTNDIAELVSEKEFFIKGRRDNIIISGGKKINPLELESKIFKFIDHPFILKGIPDEKWGEKLTLIIESENNDPSFHGTILLTQLKSVLRPWEMPKEIQIVKRLPLTDNGKLKRR